MGSAAAWVEAAPNRCPEPHLPDCKPRSQAGPGSKPLDFARTPFPGTLPREGFSPPAHRAGRMTAVPDAHMKFRLSGVIRFDFCIKNDVLSNFFNGNGF